MAQAKILGDSVARWNPDYKFFIGLTDELDPSIDYDNEIGHEIIPVKEIDIEDFDFLWKEYSIIEFNTNVKPFYFKYFIDKFSDISFLYYLDPDTKLFNSLSIVEQEFGLKGKYLLTPHILTPIPLDNQFPGENLFLNYGIFNLGFFGMKNPSIDDRLIEWWGERTYHLGYDKSNEGLFVDQLWHNFSPIFFDHVIISRNFGLNMGPWNLHERKLTVYEDNWRVNSKYPLCFYHFSNYKYLTPEKISIYYSRYNFETNSDLLALYQEYNLQLISENVQKFSILNNHYMVKRCEVSKKIKKKRIYKKLYFKLREVFFSIF